MDRPFTTLFLLQSLDGKISTGISDKRDFDEDLPKIDGLKEGLYQYYALEQQTDPVSLNSGKTQAKVGVNKRNLEEVQSGPVSYVVIDNQPHLDAHGSEYFARKSKTFFIITNNPKHPAFGLKGKYDTIHILFYPDQIDFQDAFRRLKEEHGILKMTIQTGGTLNSLFIRQGLIDQVKIVVAPCLIGGKDTPTLVDEVSLKQQSHLAFIKKLTLISCTPIAHNYLVLEYEVLK